MAGFGAAGLPLTVTATSGLGPERAGLASGLLSTARQVGSAVGLAALVAVASTGRRGTATADGAEALTAGFGVGFLVGARACSLARLRRRLALPGRQRISASDARYQQIALVRVAGATAE